MACRVAQILWYAPLYGLDCTSHQTPQCKWSQRAPLHTTITTNDWYTVAHIGSGIIQWCHAYWAT